MDLSNAVKSSHTVLFSRMKKRRFVAPVLRKLSREYDVMKIRHVACFLATVLTNIAGSHDSQGQGFTIINWDGTCVHDCGNCR